MAEYGLTPEEVLYLAAVTGADTFYGVPDMLSGLSDQELKLKVVEIESGLNERGYLEEDFDGNKSITPELIGIIDLCGKCERFLCFERERIGEPQHSRIYFLKENNAYKMEYQGGRYVFSETDFPGIRKEIKQEMPLRETEKKKEGAFTLPYEMLEKASTLIKRGSVRKGEDLMEEEGAPAYMSQVVSGGILSKADFYSLLFMDLRREEDPGCSIQCLQGDMLIAVDYEIKDDEGYVQFSIVDREELLKKVEIGFEMIDCTQEEAFC